MTEPTEPTAPEPGTPDERPHRRREYSGAPSTLGLAAVIVLAVGVAIWWFEIRGSESGGSLDSGGLGIVELVDTMNPTGKAPAAETGRAAPDFTLATGEGDTTDRLTAYRGEWVLLNFWASWCEPCRSEAPDLQKLQDRYGRAGQFTVLGVNQQETTSEVAEFQADLGVTYPTVMDRTGEVSQAYRVSRNLPVSFLIDPAGVIREVFVGRLTDAHIASVLEQVQ
ncbi:MAG: TlpA family protein disulfide reductase [Dehalococcoidia bacterium]|nr:TlpA family protein disulfide reductase [Dehalococcoidia bacterium]